MGELIAGHSKVTFYSLNGEAFILIVNGERVNRRPATRVYLDNLYPGKNRVGIKIIKHGHTVELYRPVYIKDGFHSDFVIEPQHHGYTLEKIAMKPLRNSYRGNRFEEDYYFEGDYYKRGGHNKRGNHGRKKGHPHGHKKYRYVNMDDVLYSLNDYHFDRDKLDYARRAINGKHLYARDVSRIMQEITFDDSRLDFAVFAYQFVVDKENFYKVKRAFRFRSTARKLDQRIH